MPQRFRSGYHRCFISAPFGLDLGALPGLLAEREISWEWAKDEALEARDFTAGIAAADFALIVLNGTRADYQSIFDSGVATGLRKPVLLIQTRSRPLPLDYRRFTTVKLGLSNRDALAFHLDLFLASPHPARDSERESPRSGPSPGLNKGREPIIFESNLERRVYDAVVIAGGTAIAEPRSDVGSKYRPDLLAWLGHLDPELLDPIVIEIKSRNDPKNMRGVEKQLLAYMQGARVRTALVLTNVAAPPREQQASPNIFWLTIDEFEMLTQTGHLGEYLRQARNRIVHGAK